MTTESQHSTLATPEAPRASRPRRSWMIDLLERYALVGLLVAVVIVFSIDSHTGSVFLTLPNIQAVLGNEAVVAILALAALLPLLANEFDVSIGPVAGMSSIIAASAMSHGWALVPAIVLAIACSSLVGLVNGVLVAYVQVNSFITTLAAGTLIGGLVSLYTHDAVIIQGISASLTRFGSDTAADLPWVVWIVVALAVVLVFALGWTVYGRQLTSVGVSPSAARLVGMRVKALTASTFLISSTLAGVAGVILLARTGSGNPQLGSGYTLDALSAAFLGATAFTPGRFNVLGTLTGVVFVAACVNGLTLTGASDWVDPVFTGAALMIAVALSKTLGRLRAGTTAVPASTKETHDG